MIDQCRSQLADTGNCEPLSFDTTIADDNAAIMVTLSRHAAPVRTDAESGTSMTVVAVGGDIDADTAPVLRRALAQALSDSVSVYCDLSDVTFFGAAAANTLLAVHQRATDLGRVFALSGVRAMTARVWAVVDPAGVVPRRP
jgi:anti-anti-sigma factor